MDRRELLRWQLGLAWSLGDLRLTGLTDAECRWQPAPGAWTVRPGPDGRWEPDWAEPEPEPPPTTSIGWLSWHLGWWWTTLLAHATGDRVPDRTEVAWPGSAAAAVAWLHDLHKRWVPVLDTDLDRPIRYPWPEPRPLAQAAAWANQELMKNVAEIGQVRDLYGQLSARRGR